MPLLVITFVALVFYLAACASPETTRTRGGGPGADVGNRGKVRGNARRLKTLRKTPKLIPTKHPPLAPASQADQLSRQ